MTLSDELWQTLRCVICGERASHALEAPVTAQGALSTSVLMGWCDRHYEEAVNRPDWAGLPIVDAERLLPRGAG